MIAILRAKLLKKVGKLRILRIKELPLHLIKRKKQVFNNLIDIRDEKFKDNCSCHVRLPGTVWM